MNPVIHNIYPSYNLKLTGWLPAQQKRPSENAHEDLQHPVLTDPKEGLPGSSPNQSWPGAERHTAPSSSVIDSTTCLSLDACACHLAPFSLLRVYINTNPPKKGKIFPFFLLWIKFQQTWLRIRRASQIKVCRGEGGGGSRAQTQLGLPTLKTQVRIIKSPRRWTEVLSKGYSLFG